MSVVLFSFTSSVWERKGRIGISGAVSLPSFLDSRPSANEQFNNDANSFNHEISNN